MPRVVRKGDSEGAVDLDGVRPALDRGHVLVARQNHNGNEEPRTPMFDLCMDISYTVWCIGTIRKDGKYVNTDENRTS